MDKKIVMVMDVTGTTSIITTKSTLQKDTNILTATHSVLQNSMQENCVQSVVVDLNS